LCDAYILPHFQDFVNTIQKIDTVLKKRRQNINVPFFVGGDVLDAPKQTTTVFYMAMQLQTKKQSRIVLKNF